ncbi:hypothetical protein FIBSPDRAFT_36005 [Athelia psychrophila]|uniref:Uncharacterized protein n=1 Tax=Athelia psychrophila TaxID=1759441 RepID=A0A166FST6_9AGAM|nr:hypothetical protein FIBSPDRAFT_36005 [Fibularhizoctonia sp. CBS 109695]
MYERALSNSPYHQDLKQCLMCLAFSLYPLKPEELADVVTVDLSSNGPPSYDPDLRYFGTADMLITCSGFVTETDGTFKQPCINAGAAESLFRAHKRLPPDGRHILALPTL